MSRVEVTQFFVDCRGSHFHQINQCAKNGWWGLSLFWQCQDFESACWSNHPSFNVIWGLNVFLHAAMCIFLLLAAFSMFVRSSGSDVCDYLQHQVPPDEKRLLQLWSSAAPLLHRSTLPAQPCTFKLLLLLLLRVLSTGFQSLNNISVLLYSISECKYFVISQMVRGECALRTMRTQWCICWHILLWCGYMQGCINCAILLSGIGARGVSSEHMENMEMFCVKRKMHPWLYGSMELVLCMNAGWHWLSGFLGTWIVPERFPPEA